MTVTSKHRSCPLMPENGISRSAGQLKITNLYSKLRWKICFKYSRFEEKDKNIRILFGFQNSWIRIWIFKIRGKRFKSELNPNIFDHLWFRNRWHNGQNLASFNHVGSSLFSNDYNRVSHKKFPLCLLPFSWPNFINMQSCYMLGTRILKIDPTIAGIFNVKGATCHFGNWHVVITQRQKNNFNVKLSC